MSLPYTEVSEAAKLYHKTRALHTVVTDVVVIRDRRYGEDGWFGGEVLLIKRGREPFVGCHALPGGFVEAGERTIDAALRELEEETGLRSEFGDLIGIFDFPGRDPRGPNVGVAYLVTDFEGAAVGGDDATEAAWFPLERLPPLAFDHADIILAALAAFDHRNCS